MFSKNFVASVIIALAVCSAASQPPDAFNVTITQIDASGFPDVGGYVSVTDAAGSPVLGLGPEAFAAVDGPEVLEDVLVGPVTGEAVPVAVVLLVDTSGSMRGAKIGAAKEAASGFVARLQPGDQASVMGFCTEVATTGGFSSDKAELNRRITTLDVRRENTCLYDGISVAVDELNSLEGFTRRAIVVLTDGYDNASEVSRTDVSAKAVGAGVNVYTIGLGDPDEYDEFGLRELALDTYGDFFAVPTPENLGLMYQRISDQLRNQYEVSYQVVVPEDTPEGPASRTMSVTVTYAGGMVTATRDYDCTVKEVEAGFGWGRLILFIVVAIIVIAFITALAIYLVIKSVKSRRGVSEFGGIDSDILPSPEGDDFETDFEVVAGGTTGDEGETVPIDAIGEKPVAGKKSAAAPWGELVVVKGPEGVNRGLSYGLSGDTVLVGRSDSNDIVLRGDDAVSGKHFSLKYVTGGKATLADEGSSNGTYVSRAGGSFEKMGSCEILRGDIIAVGENWQLKFDIYREGTRVIG
jgi:VWFA-related protein